MIDEASEQMALSPAIQDVEPTEAQNRMLHKTIAAVTRDTESLSFNTAIARMMEFVNFFTKESVRPRSVVERFVLLLAPYAPHIAEELWSVLGHEKSLSHEPWPSYDEKLLLEATIEVPFRSRARSDRA